MGILAITRLAVGALRDSQHALERAAEQLRGVQIDVDSREPVVSVILRQDVARALDVGSVTMKSLAVLVEALLK